MGGGGKGGSTQKVPYYYMSIQYGICHGPLDVLNQIWIKEKEVFCGQIDQSGVVYLNDTELFGGEEKEGGISGVAEVYFGDADQRLTNISAARFSKTSETMPGYRGVANIFFRGYDDKENSYKPSSSRDGKPAQIFKSFSVLSGLIANLFNAVNPFRALGGFNWLTNNPYLPGAWAHVTRIGVPFAPELAAVYPAASGSPQAFPITPQAVVKSNGSPDPFADGNFATFEVSSLYLPIIQSGTAKLQISYTASFFRRPPFSGPDTGTVQIWARAYDADDNELSFLVSEGGGVADANLVNNYTLTFTRTIPANAVRIEYVCRSVYLGITTRVVHSVQETSLIFSPLGPLLCSNSTAIGSPPDMNPAHIVAECLTNRLWGMGKPLAALDLDSFTYAAQTFYDEHFGLSLQWKEQMTIEKFIVEILDHVQATMFLDPRTGLYRLIPIRGDYDADDLFVFNSTNSTTRNRQRKGQGEIINEIVVSYVDFSSEESKTVVFQDLASISQLGQIVSETRDYYGIRHDSLANFVGARDIRTASYPLFSCDVESDRSGSFVYPGAVVKLTIPEDGIENMICRVIKVDYGEAGDRRVRFNVMEDIFSLDVTTFASAQESLWEDPDQDPEPLPYQRAIEAPLPMIIRAGIPASDVSDDDYPSVVTALLGEDPDLTIEYLNIWGDEVQANGDVTQKIIGATTVTPVGFLPDPLVAEAESTLPDTFVVEVARPQVAEPGMILYLDGDNETGEFIMLDSLTAGVWTVARGVYDTVPKAWPDGHLVWFCDTGIDSFDPTQNSAGVPTTFKLLPKTSGGELDQTDATEITYTPGERPYLPFRPADVTLAGVSFGDLSYAQDDPGGLPTALVASWATRNRTTEDTLVVRWTEPSVTPEVGQTTTLRFRDSFDGTIAWEISGLTGDTHTFDSTVTDLENYRFYRVEFLSVRDGFESLQAHSIGLSIERLGYGFDYGYDYGENDGAP